VKGGLSSGKNLDPKSVPIDIKSSVFDTSTTLIAVIISSP
jgi:hypothetical protein